MKSRLARSVRWGVATVSKAADGCVLPNMSCSLPVSYPLSLFTTPESLMLLKVGHCLAFVRDRSQLLWSQASPLPQMPSAIAVKNNSGTDQTFALCEYPCADVFYPAATRVHSGLSVQEKYRHDPLYVPLVMFNPIP